MPFIVACGQESAEDIIDNSVQAYEEVESFHMTMEQSMNFDEDESFDLTSEADMTLDPFTMEQTMFIEEEEMRVRFVDGTIYFEEPMSETWLEMEEDLEEIMGEVYGVDGLTEEELVESENLVPLLEELREREEEITVEETEDDSVHILSYSAEGEEAQELVMGLDLGGEMELQDLLAEEDGDMSIDNIDVTLTFDADTYYILEQETQFSGTIEDDIFEEELNYSQEVVATYSQFNEVEPIEAPEEVTSFSDFLYGGLELEDDFEADFELEEEAVESTDDEPETGSVTAFDSVITSVDSYDVLTSLMIQAPEGEFVLNEEGTVNGYLDSGHFHIDGGTDGEENEAEIYWDHSGEYLNDNNQGWETVEYSPIGVDSLYDDVAASLIDIYSSYGSTTEEEDLVSIDIEGPLDDETVVETIEVWLEGVADLSQLGIDFTQEVDFELTTALTDDQEYIERVLFNLEQDGTILYFEYIYSNWDEAEEVTIPDEVLEEAGA